MAGLDKHSRTTDCNGANADAALRHDFLSAVSQLPHVDLSSRRDLGLAHTIEAEIIPRLMLAHRSGQPLKRHRDRDLVTIDSNDIARFSAIICEANIIEARSFIADLQSRSVTVESIMLDLLAPTAKLLGEMWEEDDADFALVTIALCCLQQILRDISGIFQTLKTSSSDTFRALLAPVPGEQHIFSVLMVDEFFRRAQWDVWTMPAATENELVDLLRRERFDMAGLSISCDTWLPQLKSLILRIRRASLNKDIVIMVGGRPLTERPSLVDALGADGTAANGLDAVQKAHDAVKAVMNGKISAVVR